MSSNVFSKIIIPKFEELLLWWSILWGSIANTGVHLRSWIGVYAVRSWIPRIYLGIVSSGRYLAVDSRGTGCRRRRITDSVSVPHCSSWRSGFSFWILFLVCGKSASAQFLFTPWAVSLWLCAFSANPAPVSYRWWSIFILGWGKRDRAVD